ncbi:MAG: CPBP family intramembrane metalloprotease [Oscillospiraceae bacterium]|nr:CPBP family intramembrane metalloprotease [Oscillospiraceae bacterium]
MYKENEIRFAVFCIMLYCALTVPARSKGDDSLLMLGTLTVETVLIAVFVKRSQLEHKYGLDRWPADTKEYLYFIPMWILTTGNAWDGVEPYFEMPGEIYAALSLILVGFVEEMLFRGFLFRALIPQTGVRKAVVISALTFGIGHIVNLFNGQATLLTLVQVVFALGWGFMLTLVYLKCGSIWPCIVAHSLVDAISVIGKDTEKGDWIYIIVTIAASAAYCLYLSKLDDFPLDDEEVIIVE